MLSDIILVVICMMIAATWPQIPAMVNEFVKRTWANMRQKFNV